ncbi:hypothetical protein [Erwinia rhapontici]|uniref:hypothetical protein n=1 Tax=Erwinia rhapontici TaxID=55212 RepID=UPI003BA121B7
MSEAEEVETVYAFSNDLALRRDVDIGLSSSNRIAGTNNQLNNVSRGNFEKIFLILLLWDLYFLLKLKVLLFHIAISVKASSHL